MEPGCRLGCSLRIPILTARIEIKAAIFLKGCAALAISSVAKGETLILHHVEPMWGEMAEAVVEPIIRHLRRAEYSEVILTTLEGDHGFKELIPYVTRVEGWSYGWESTPEDAAREFGMNQADFICVSTPHEVAYLYPWIKELQAPLKVCGGHRDECLADMVQTLDHLGKRYRTLDHLVYG